MRPRSLRGRLTAAADRWRWCWPSRSSASCARLLVAQQLHSSLDSSLRQRATDVARLSVSAPALLTAPGALESPSPAVSSRSRSSIAHGRSWPARWPWAPSCCRDAPVVADALRRGHGGFADVALGGDPVRLYAAPDRRRRRARGRRRRPRRLEHHRHRRHAAPARPAAPALRGLPGRRRCGAAAAVLTRRGLGPLRACSAAAARDRAHRRRVAPPARAARRRRGRRADAHAQPDARRARRRAPARAPLPRRRQPRAAHAGDVAGRQRRVRRAPRRQPGGAGRPAARHPAPAEPGRRPAGARARERGRRPERAGPARADGGAVAAGAPCGRRLRAGDGARRARRAARPSTTCSTTPRSTAPRGVAVAITVSSPTARGRVARHATRAPGFAPGSEHALRALLARPRRRGTAPAPGWAWPSSSDGRAPRRSCAGRLDGDGDASDRGREEGSVTPI